MWAEGMALSVVAISGHWPRRLTGCAVRAARDNGATSAAAAASAVLPSRGLLAAGAQASSR